MVSVRIRNDLEEIIFEFQNKHDDGGNDGENAEENDATARTTPVADLYA